MHQLTIGSFDIGVVRSPSIRRRANWARGSRGAFGLATAAGLLLALAAPASAGSTGAATGNVDVAPPPVKSITVSPGSFSYTSCGGPNGASTTLQIPGGQCQSSTIVVTNTGAPAQIWVSTGDMIPADGGAHWTPGETPGPDVFRLAQSSMASFNAAYIPYGLGVIDSFINPVMGPAASGTQASEQFALLAPTSSSDTSTSWHHVITWTAN